jgi:MscS family membrane protein
MSLIEADLPSGRSTRSRRPPHARLGRLLVAFVALPAALLAPPSARAAAPTLKDLLGTGAAKAAAPQAEPSAAEPPAAAVQPSAALPVGATPQSTVTAFLDACNGDDYERAARFLQLPPARRPEPAGLARELCIVLAQTTWIDVGQLSTAPDGYTDDGLPADQERLGEVTGPEGEVPLRLVRMRGPEGEQVWKFAAKTLAQVPALYQVYGYGPLGEVLPRVFFQIRYLGVQLWQWIGLIALVLLAAGVGSGLAFLVTATLRWMLRRLGAHHLVPSRGPLRLLLAVGLFSAGTWLLHLSVATLAVVTAFERALVILAVTWMFLRVPDGLEVIAGERLLARGQDNVVPLLSAARKTAKAVIVLVAIVVALDSFGFDVTALIAGLGVGGIAVALAAQKSLENLFGALMLFADRPVRVGDFCSFGGHVGTVEEIGMRSTKIRTLDRTVVSVPNSEFANMQLENYARRDKIWYHPTLGLRYETTPDQMRFVLVEIRKMLYAHPKVDPDPARIRFVGFGAYSLDLEVFAYVTATDYGEFLEIAEDLNLRIMDIVARAGTGFAFPSQTTYLEQGDGLDEKRTREAEAAVAQWRESGTLYLPRFPREKIAEIGDTLDYPPRGAPRWNGS